MSLGRDVEWLALRAGLKPAIRVTVDRDQAGAVAARFEGEGAHVARAAGWIESEARDREVLFVALERRRAEEVRDAEAPGLAGRGRLFQARSVECCRRVGALLGYPPCCIEAFAGRMTRGIGVLPGGGERRAAEAYVAVLEAWVPRPRPRLNTLLRPARLHLVSHEPCRFDCRPSLAYADACQRELARCDAAAAEALDRALAQSMVISSSGARAVVVVGRVPVAHVDRSGAPPGADGRAGDARDQAFARSLVAVQVGAHGAVAIGREPFPVLVDFSAG